jgi:hypothetical protein
LEFGLKLLKILLYIYIQQKNQQRWTIAQSKKNMSVRVETMQHLYLLVPHFPSSSAMNDSRKNAKTKTTKKL